MDARESLLVQRRAGSFTADAFPEALNMDGQDSQDSLLRNSKLETRKSAVGTIGNRQSAIGQFSAEGAEGGREPFSYIAKSVRFRHEQRVSRGDVGGEICHALMAKMAPDPLPPSPLSLVGGGGALRTVANFASKWAGPIAIASAVIDATAIGVCTSGNQR